MDRIRQIDYLTAPTILERSQIYNGILACHSCENVSCLIRIATPESIYTQAVLWVTSGEKNSQSSKLHVESSLADPADQMHTAA